MKYRIFIALLLYLLLNGSVFSQTSDLVSISVEKVFLKSGSSSFGKINVKIREGYHIQSNKVDDEYIIPTELEIKGVKYISLVEQKYPESNQFNLEGSDIVLNVFDGEIEIEFKLQIDTQIMIRSYQLEANLRYQACDSKSCFAPRSIDFEIPIEIIN